MEILFHAPDVAKCIGCGVECGVVGDFGLADPLCPACEQSACLWEAEKTFASATSIILARPPFDSLSLEDRQELLNQFFAGIGYVPEAVHPYEAEQWFNPPQDSSPSEYRVHVQLRNGTTGVLPWRS